jgi:hypothetical protein
MKTFLGFTTGLLAGAIGGTVITGILVSADETYYKALKSVWNGQKPEKSEKSDYDVNVEDLSN